MTDTGRKFYLSWSHYLKLMRISNVEMSGLKMKTKLSVLFCVRIKIKLL